MYLAGMKSGGMLHFDGEKVRMSATLPAGTHNAQPYRDGVLFNDTQADTLRYAGRGDGAEDRALAVPTYPQEELTHSDVDTSALARQGFRAAWWCSMIDWWPVVLHPRPSACMTCRTTSACCRCGSALTSVTPFTAWRYGLTVPAVFIRSGRASRMSASSSCHRPRQGS